ncbi:MAG: hypothetical protein ABIW82_18650 [Dokdonella sp.]
MVVGAALAAMLSLCTNLPAMGCTVVGAASAAMLWLFFQAPKKSQQWLWVQLQPRCCGFIKPQEIAAMVVGAASAAMPLLFLQTSKKAAAS